MTNLEKAKHLIEKLMKMTEACYNWGEEDFNEITYWVLNLLEVVGKKRVEAVEKTSSDRVMEIEKRERQFRDTVRRAKEYAEAMQKKADEAKENARTTEIRIKEQIIRELSDDTNKMDA